MRSQGNKSAIKFHIMLQYLIFKTIQIRNLIIRWFDIRHFICDLPCLKKFIKSPCNQSCNSYITFLPSFLFIFLTIWYYIFVKLSRLDWSSKCWRLRKFKASKVISRSINFTTYHFNNGAYRRWRKTWNNGSYEKKWCKIQFLNSAGLRSRIWTTH